MSKGSIILGDVSGKLGDIVLYRTAGAQVARLRIRHPRNPRSTRQMVQRIFQATCLRAYSMLKDICDHSFEGKQGKKQNYGEFVRINRTKMNELLNDYAEGWQNLKGFNLKGQLRMLYFPYIIANGSLPKVNYTGVNGYIALRDFRTTNYNFTYQNLVDALNIKKGDELTVLQLNYNDETGVINYIKKARIIMEPSNGNMTEQFADATTKEINMPNALNEGSPQIVPSANGMQVRLGFLNECGAVILSRFENGMWKRSFADLYMHFNIINPFTLGDAVKSWWQTPARGKYLNKAERQLHID